MAGQNFDVVVIGAGPGGYVAAIRAAQLGQKVAIVERENLGGICLNWGCIPTKALLRASEINHMLHSLDAYGFAADNIRFDFAKVVKRSRSVAGQLSGGVARGLGGVQRGLLAQDRHRVIHPQPRPGPPVILAAEGLGFPLPQPVLFQQLLELLIRRRAKEIPLQIVLTHMVAAEPEEFV